MSTTSNSNDARWLEVLLSVTTGSILAILIGTIARGAIEPIDPKEPITDVTPILEPECNASSAITRGIATLRIELNPGFSPTEIPVSRSCEKGK